MPVEFGKTLVLIGICLALLGSILWFGSDFFRHVPVGRLPGDIFIQNDRFTFYFPLTTGILLSLAITGLFWLVKLLSR
jgi:hypothetical protein